MKINHHLMKKSPIYKVKNQPYLVKLVKLITYNIFTAEIINGDHVGKWTTVEKKDLTAHRGMII